MAIKIAAFGALNGESYGVFAARVAYYANKCGRDAAVVSAGPYPNAAAVSEPGRPLRAEALQDEAKKRELCAAVAADARKIGAAHCGIRCMPCMSMIGFHDGVERALGLDIVRLSDALSEKYKNIDRVGVIHMRPAKKRIEEIFGARAVGPDEAQSAQLLAAEEEAKKIKSAAPVEAVMKSITETWRDQGLRHVLFARADAPQAKQGPAGQVEGIEIDDYFDILAEYIIKP